MGRRLWFASAFVLSGTRIKRRMNPQGRLGEKEPLSAIHSQYKFLQTQTGLHDSGDVKSVTGRG